MSARARRYDRAEPNKKRPKRKRPRGQLVATITTFMTPPDGDEGRHTYYIRRRRVRTRIHPDGEPGKDGFRWTCTCVEITRAYLGTAAGRKLFADGRTDCTHMASLLAGELAEGTAPDVCVKAARKMGIEWKTYVELTKLGEDLLRWRWAMRALKDPSDS